MSLLNTLFGHGRDLNALQMSCRAAVAFFDTLVLIRIAGIRTFGNKSAFDNVIIIMLGSILSRVVVGASPFIPTTVACLVFVLIHWALGWISLYNERIGAWVKGEGSVLYKDGRENAKNMRAARISRKDLLEGLRLKINDDRLDRVKEIHIERNGEISVIKEQ